MLNKDSYCLETIIEADKSFNILVKLKLNG
jgi:hypothetical protein